MDFSETKLSLTRPLRSYSKLQRLYGHLIRNRKFQIKRDKLDRLRYVNVGCGANITDKYLNLDYFWKPGIDLCWDVTKGIPCKENTIKGIFTEHCLEHISFSACKDVIAEFFRILRPGGVVRIIVPDAELYIELYIASRGGKEVRFPNQGDYVFEDFFTPLMAVNRIFRDHEHLYAYDFETMSALLSRQGFIEIKKQSFRRGLESELLVDSEQRKDESLYLEARKPT